MPLKIGTKEFTKQQTVFLSVGAALVLVLILVVFGVLPGGKGGRDETSITVWVIDEDTDVWKTTVSRFRDSRQDAHVSIEEIPAAIFEDELINALAAGRGPDVFMFNNKWLVEHGDKVAPTPSSKMTISTFSGLFPQVAEQDFISSERIYAIPLAIDTLALIYNRDILDAKGVVFPPKTWAEFATAVTKIRTFENATLTTKAASIGGTSASTRNASDILSLLMLQNGSPIVNESYTRADFGSKGETGVMEYVKYATPQNPLYTWSDSFGRSNNVFAEEEVAMTFAYPEDVKEILDTNPFLDFEISAIPQVNVATPVNYANYWGLTVASGSQNVNAAWDFVIFATTDRTSAESYIKKTGHAPALRFLIDDYLNDPAIGVFAKQALSAKGWPQPDDDVVSEAFDDMIKGITSGEMTVDKAMDEAESTLTELIRR